MFDNNCPTIGAQYVTIQEIVNNEEVTLEIWDTSGDLKYEPMKYIYYKDINLVLLLFDLNSYESLMYIKRLLIKLELESRIKKKYILIGNKLDLKERKVDENVIKENFSDIIQYIEISIKNNTNLEKLNQIIKNEILEYIEYVDNTEDDEICNELNLLLKKKKYVLSYKYYF